MEMKEMANECVSCGCEPTAKPVQYKCDCGDCGDMCSIIGFDSEPQAAPYCCGAPMKRIK
jgi:hypothetical protein